MNRKQLHYDDDSNLIMDEHNISLICEQEGLYEFPELNKKLYLNNKNFIKIDNLSKYINIKVLYLCYNRISKLENLKGLDSLQHLFLQGNFIKTIENLDCCSQLMTLNLEKNEIEHVENLQNLRFLQNLDLSYNHLRTASSIEHLSLCESLSTVDLRHNYIDFDENLLPIFEKIPTLKVLYLKNNPLVRDFANYRKQLVGKLKELTYLDDRPVNLEEKRLCFAWVLNGALGFQQEKEKIAQEKKDQVNAILKENFAKSYQKKIQSVITFWQTKQRQQKELPIIDQRLRIAEIEGNQPLLEEIRQEKENILVSIMELSSSISCLLKTMKKFKERYQELAIYDEELTKNGIDSSKYNNNEPELLNENPEHHDQQDQLSDSSQNGPQEQHQTSSEKSENSSQTGNTYNSTNFDELE